MCLSQLLVVARGIVGARVRAARLGAGERALGHAEREIDHALELEGAHEVEVEDAAGVAQADLAAAFLEAAQGLEALAHDCVLAEHAEVVARGGDHLGADGVRVGAVRTARRELGDPALHGGDSAAAGAGGVPRDGLAALKVGHHRVRRHGARRRWSRAASCRRAGWPRARSRRRTRRRRRDRGIFVRPSTSQSMPPMV